MQKQQGVGSSNYDTVTTTYNFSGVNEAIYNSVPCTKTSGGSCGSTTGFTRYVDMLGRTVEKKDSGRRATRSSRYAQNDVTAELKPGSRAARIRRRVQNESDGLGRPTKSCKISATASGHVTCGETHRHFQRHPDDNDVLCGAAAIAHRDGQPRAEQPAAAEDHSRWSWANVTSKVTPEGGTWTYKYDSNTSCPSGYQGAKGMLASVADPNVNLICYKYDALNRVIGVNATGTTCRHFYFDSTFGTVPTGVTTPTYTQGRLAEASTDNCSGTLITDEWFSYDKDGNVIDQWESTPNSAQYYHSSATFTGPALLTMDLASPSEYTLTYGLDGEGRLNSVKNGTNVIATIPSGGYNAASQPLTINLGTSPSTDADTYTYDPLTGHMSTWLFQVNSQDESGQIYWNSNGTVYKLRIQDSMYSGGAQICWFDSTVISGTGYDDLGRLIGSDCGSGIWNQTDSYDQYDNLTKASTGFVSWNPGYSQTTNHYTCTGCTYDSNGNVTNDGTTAYTWNEFSKMKKAGTQSMIYDAFGRTVEIDGTSANTEIWYTQLGKTAFMNGTTFKYAYAPAPGGGTLWNRSTSLTDYLHKDWLGNARIASNVPASGNGGVFTDQAYAPYGEVYNIYNNPDQQNVMFDGGSTQDVLAGMYDTPNRELQGSQQGRWLSPDPAGSGWNQYAYPTNPNGGIDPTGLACFPRYEATCNGAGLSGANTAGSGESGAAYGAGWTPYGVWESEVVIQTVGADAASSSSTPVFCGCADDVTSGVLGSTFAPLPADLFGPAPIDGGTPSAVEIGDLLFQYQGPDPGGFGPAGSTIVVNVWQEYVVDVNGNHVQGDFLVNEQVQEMQPNNVTSPTTAGPPWQGGSIVDNIGFGNPTGFVYNFVQQTFSVTYPNGTTIPLSTVINQFSIYQNGSLIVGGPSIAIP